MTGADETSWTELCRGMARLADDADVATRVTITVTHTRIAGRVETAEHRVLAAFPGRDADSRRVELIWEGLEGLVHTARLSGRVDLTVPAEDRAGHPAERSAPGTTAITGPGTHATPGTVPIPATTIDTAQHALAAGRDADGRVWQVRNGIHLTQLPASATGGCAPLLARATTIDISFDDPFTDRDVRHRALAARLADGDAAGPVHIDTGWFPSPAARRTVVVAALDAGTVPVAGGRLLADHDLLDLAPTLPARSRPTLADLERLGALDEALGGGRGVELIHIGLAQARALCGLATTGTEAAADPAVTADPF